VVEVVVVVGRNESHPAAEGYATEGCVEAAAPPLLGPKAAEEDKGFLAMLVKGS